MRALVIYCFAAVTAIAQGTSNSSPELPKEPLALLQAAALHYNFNDPAMRPFHLKATYQLYDESGQPAEKASVAQGMLLKKVIPVYPQDAKEAHVDGKVVLEAIIGMDGGIHDLRVISAPWPSLAASALWSVSQWKYKPYLLNGKAVDVKTTINVIYSLGY